MMCALRGVETLNGLGAFFRGPILQMVSVLVTNLKAAASAAEPQNSIFKEYQ